MKHLFSIFLIFLFTFSLFSENLRYVVKWFGIKVARMSIKIADETSTVRMEANLRTVGIFRITSPVVDRFESKWNKKNKIVEYFKEEINEKEYHYREETNSVSKGTVDPLTFVYLLRFLDSKKSEQEHSVYSHKKIKKVVLEIIGEENINIYEKNFKTIKVIPITEFRNLEGVASKVRKMKVWLVGEEKIPLLAEIESEFGKITLLLENRDRFAEIGKK